MDQIDRNSGRIIDFNDIQQSSEDFDITYDISSSDNFPWDDYAFVVI